MNLHRRVLTLLLFACMLTLSASAASADPAPLQTITTAYPIASSTATYPYMSFGWNHLWTNSYRLIIRSTDGQQKAVVPVNGGLCIVTTCNASINYQASGWKWRENTQYVWQVKGFDANGVLVAKSAKRSFVTDMVHPISLTSPTYGTNVGHSSVNFSWVPDSSVGAYRLVITRPDGVKVHSAWIPYNAICTQTCAYSFSFLEYANGAYQWHVEGRHDAVTGKSKSTKLALNVVG